jgi:hypothetical protein
MGLWSFLRGTTSNSFGIGDGVDSDKKIEANVPGANKPTLRFNHTTAKWEVSHNGTDFFEVGATTLPLSLWEKGWGEVLIPADGLTAIHMGGLWEEDADGNFKPKDSPDASVDEFWEVDGADNLVPKAA